MAHRRSRPTIVFAHANGFPAGTYGVLSEAWRAAGWRAHGFRMLEASGLIRRAGPGRISARRRTRWPSMQAVREHFEAERAFASWDRRVFDDYLRHGFEPDPAGGVQLAFRREDETQVYHTLPHHVSDLLRRHPPRYPVAYVAGTRSFENRQLGLACVRRLAGTGWRWFLSSHTERVAFCMTR